MMRTRLIAGPVTGLVLSAILATALALVSSADTLVEPLRVDPSLPAPVTLRLPAHLVLHSSDDGEVLQVERHLIRRGETTASPEIGSAVRAYESARRPPSATELGSLWLLYFLLASIFTTYLRSFSPSRGALLRTQAGILGMASVLLAAGKGFLLLTDFSELALPVGALSLWCAFYLDRRTALMLSVAMAFFAASLVGFRLVSVAVYLAAGLAGTVTFRNRIQARGMLASGLAAGLASGLVFFAARVVFEGGQDLSAEIADPLHSESLAAIAGGVLSGFIAFLLQGIAVLALGAVSRGRLMDLTDLNQPLLRKMKEDAPGSWEHSRAMANLAEGAAVAIGADALLTRVGAYYHDLGKSVQPKYFVENLVGGEPSPHDGLAPHVSADAIMAHVVEGTRILREGGIPEPVVEFAYTHHGTSVIEFFWHRCEEEGNPLGLTKAAFQYPGMRPRTKETGILMLVDAIEAAARTLDPPTREKFAALVQRVIFGKLHQGQLDESRLNMEDLRRISTNLVETLCSAYHSRIKYPWQKKEEEEEEEEEEEAARTNEEPAREAVEDQTIDDDQTVDEDQAVDDQTIDDDQADEDRIETVAEVLAELEARAGTSTQIVADATLASLGADLDAEDDGALEDEASSAELDASAEGELPASSLAEALASAAPPPKETPE